MLASMKGRESEQDFDLNIASIIDCFTVLITYLLVSASFLSIGILDVDLVGVGLNDENTPQAPVTIGLRVESGGRIRVEVSGHPTHKVALAELDVTLKSLRKDWFDVHNITVTADDSVAYVEIVKTVEAAKQHYEHVSLSEGS